MMSVTPIALIHCRVIDSSLPTCLPLDCGFQVTPSGHDNILPLKVVPFHVIELYAGTRVTVGRDPGPRSNALSIANSHISRTHFQIYTIVFEDVEASTPNPPPMIYVRDRQSLTGTFVNGRMIGSRASGVSPGYLLAHGDIITIQPHWEFRVCLTQHESPSARLPEIQNEESKFFSDRYVITNRILGTGSYGQIYLAVNVRSKLQLACKIIDLHRLYRGKDDLQSLIRSYAQEANVLSKIRHPNLLTYEHAFRSKHTIYIFSELATGGDLFSMIDSHGGALSELRTKFVMFQVVRAVAYLHKKNLAHRDLKPENVYFSSGPSIKNRIIVGDFGHTKAASWGRFKTCTLGTDLYQAPEIYFHHSSYTKSVDMWALGIMILYIMMPSTRSQLSTLKSKSQKSIDEYLVENFGRTNDSGDQNGQDGQDGRDFVSSCLRVNPDERMTAAQAKSHPWLCVPKRVVEDWTRIRNSSWKPNHRTPPPVEELPDLDGLSIHGHVELVPGSSSQEAFNLDGRLKRKQDSIEASSEEGKRSNYFDISEKNPEPTNEAKVDG